MKTTVYVVSVYCKANDTMILRAEFKSHQMDQYESCVAGLDLATDYYYDVEVVRV